VQPLSTPEDLLYAEEIRLHEEEAMRRRSLNGQKTEQEIDAMMEEEFGERRRQLLCKMYALQRGS
jgi:hypothetical protein